jgi:RNA polymerase sigma-70 factor (ECF subfamily)
VSALWASESRAPRDGTESYAAALYERHYPAVFRHCLKQLRRREDADDAVQTTFVYALLSLRRGVVPHTELAWLYTIASNVCSSSRRAFMRRGPLAAAQDVDALHDVIPTPDRNVPVNADDFRSALGSMPPAQRKALLLREWQGLSYNEIADKLGLTQSATETLLFRARRTLAHKLEDKTGVGTVNGFSVAALIRSFLQSGAGKAVAVALSATAIAVTPAAGPKVQHAGHQTPPFADRAVVGETAPAARGSSLHARSAVTNARHALPGVDGQVADVRAEAGQAPVEAVAVEEPKATALVPTPAAAAPPASAESPPSPLDAVVATTTDALPDAGIPSIPPVEVAVSPLPDVELPGVTVPDLISPLPVG